MLLCRRGGHTGVQRDAWYGNWQCTLVFSILEETPANPPKFVCKVASKSLSAVSSVLEETTVGKLVIKLVHFHIRCKKKKDLIRAL